MNTFMDFTFLQNTTSHYLVLVTPLKLVLMNAINKIQNNNKSRGKVILEKLARELSAFACEKLLLMAFQASSSILILLSLVLLTVYHIFYS